MTVQVPGRPYPVLVGQGALQDLGPLVREMGASGVVMITDEVVGPLWAPAALASLSGSGIDCPLLTVAAGEAAKTMGWVEKALGFLERSGVDRRGVVVALGGGTVGDLAGFAAAIWLRGVRVVQVPTTLLAMVDSSVGGKTGVNTERAKNAVGAFWQPALVLSDLAVLATLPATEVEAAFGEVVKYAVAMDAELAETIDGAGNRLLARETELLERVVTRCVELKAAVVAADERDLGGRAILNYGHTIGHAVESASGYRAAHGRAVALGMRGALRVAVRVRLCDPGLEAVQDRLLAQFGLPGPLPAVDADAVLAALPLDKKASGGRIGWVLPRRLGRCEVGRSAPSAVVESVVRELLA